MSEGPVRGLLRSFREEMMGTWVARVRSQRRVDYMEDVGGETQVMEMAWIS